VVTFLYCRVHTILVPACPLTKTDRPTAPAKRGLRCSGTLARAPGHTSGWLVPGPANRLRRPTQCTAGGTNGRRFYYLGGSGLPPDSRSRPDRPHRPHAIPAMYVKPTPSLTATGWFGLTMTDIGGDSFASGHTGYGPIPFSPTLPSTASPTPLFSCDLEPSGLHVRADPRPLVHSPFSSSVQQHHREHLSRRIEHLRLKVRDPHQRQRRRAPPFKIAPGAASAYLGLVLHLWPSRRPPRAHHGSVPPTAKTASSNNTIGTVLRQQPLSRRLGRWTPSRLPNAGGSGLLDNTQLASSACSLLLQHQSPPDPVAWGPVRADRRIGPAFPVSFSAQHSPYYTSLPSQWLRGTSASTPVSGPCLPPIL